MLAPWRGRVGSILPGATLDVLFPTHSTGLHPLSLLWLSAVRARGSSSSAAAESLATSVDPLSASHPLFSPSPSPSSCIPLLPFPDTARPRFRRFASIPLLPQDLDLVA